MTLDHWINTTTSFFYTNRCYANYAYPLPFETKPLVSETSGPRSTTFSHSRYLFHDCRLAIQKTFLSRFTHVFTLIVDGNPNIDLEYITTCWVLSYITKFLYSESVLEMSNNRFVQILHTVPSLRYLYLLVLLFDRYWPQIVHLNMKSTFYLSHKSLRSTEIDLLWNLGTHLNQLEFSRQSLQDLT